AGERHAGAIRSVLGAGGCRQRCAPRAHRGKGRWGGLRVPNRGGAMTAMNEMALVLRSSHDMTAAPGSPDFERTATSMAREFAEATADMARAVAMLRAATKRMDAAFKTDDDPDHHWSRFRIDIEFCRHRCDDAAELQKLLEREAWRVLVDKLGIK